jgi:hypothetical protein
MFFWKKEPLTKEQKERRLIRLRAEHDAIAEMANVLKEISYSDKRRLIDLKTQIKILEAEND